MIYSYLLMVHSWWRWAVLLILITAILKAFAGYKRGLSFEKQDVLLLIFTNRIVGIQFLLGLGLYLTSPLTRHFISNFSEAIHQRDLRFFGLEHATMMLIAVAVIEAGAARVKKQHADKQKFKTMLYWLTVGLLIILTSIPWSFSPFTARPLFRVFW